MYIGDSLIIYLGSLAEQVIDSAVDHFLVARHRCSRKNNCIIFLDTYKSMILVSYASESRGWFSLTTSTDDDHTLRWKFVNVFRTDEHSFRNVQVPKIDRHLHIIDRTAPYQCNHTLIATGGINNLLHAREQRRKGSYNDAPWRIRKNFIE